MEKNNVHKKRKVLIIVFIVAIIIIAVSIICIIVNEKSKYNEAMESANKLVDNVVNEIMEDSRIKQMEENKELDILISKVDNYKNSVTLTKDVLIENKVATSEELNNQKYNNWDTLKELAENYVKEKREMTKAKIGLMKSIEEDNAKGRAKVSDGYAKLIDKAISGKSVNKLSQDEKMATMAYMLEIWKGLNKKGKANMTNDEKKAFEIFENAKVKNELYFSEESEDLNLKLQTLLNAANWWGRKSSLLNVGKNMIMENK